MGKGQRAERAWIVIFQGEDQDGSQTDQQKCDQQDDLGVERQSSSFNDIGDNNKPDAADDYQGGNGQVNDPVGGIGEQAGKVACQGKSGVVKSGDGMKNCVQQGLTAPHFREPAGVEDRRSDRL